jgi:Rps23 Pro-64 3,4-dihydroxylase Tpa1-like proline 4-hydroxylase
MKKGAGINWHDDHTWKYGATYYINRRWNENWSGEFMFKDKNSHGYLPCRGNSLVIVKAPIQHKVNPVLSPIMPRMSIQIFMR